EGGGRDVGGGIWWRNAPFVTRPAPVEISNHEPRDSEIELRFGTARLRIARLLVGLYRLQRAAQVVESNTHVVMRLGVIRLERRSLAIGSQGLVDCVLSLQGITQFVPVFYVTRLERDRPPVTFDCLL